MSKDEQPSSDAESSSNEELFFESREDMGKIQRELRSIKQSPSYMVGRHIAESYPSIVKIAALPITLPMTRN